MGLKLVATNGSPTFRLLTGLRYVVGRAGSSDLPVVDASVSRRHAEVEIAEGGLRIRDLGSTNGTFVDGHRVAEALAAPGAQLAFGKVDFTLENDRPILGAGAADDPLEATILRRLPVAGPADVAAILTDKPVGASQLRIAGASYVERQGRKLALLLDIAKELSQQPDVDRLLDKVVGLAFQVLNVDRVAIMLVDETGELTPRIERQKGASPQVKWRIPRSIARKVLLERIAVLVENLPADQRFTGGSGAYQAVQSAICAPLLGSQGAVLGLIYLDNLEATHSFAEEDLEFLTAFSAMTAVAIENSRLLDRTRREAVVLSNFQRYFTPELARQISDLTGEIRLGGAKRSVVVLFSDIRGFTALAERLSPDEIATLLTDYFTEMVEIVFQHGGTLDKFMGDALMALWGAPIGRRDDADRAVAAAVAMEKRIAELNQEWTLNGRQAMRVGIGMNAGDAFAGNIGSDRRLEYTVIGDAVNVAARLCAEAEGGEILIGEGLYEQLTEPPPVTSLPPVALRGRAQPVPVLRVHWSVR